MENKNFSPIIVIAVLLMLMAFAMWFNRTHKDKGNDYTPPIPQEIISESVPQSNGSPADLYK